MNLQAYQIDILQKYIEGDIGKVQCKSVSVSQVEILRNKLRVLRELNVTLENTMRLSATRPVH